jgi:hypothetical protein
VNGLAVQETNSNITQIDAPTSSQSGKKHVTLESERKYRKMKRAEENETEKQTRLENMRDYKKAKQAVESQTERQTRIENDKQ